MDCGYRGMPTERALLRSYLGTNISLRRQLLLEGGGFDGTERCTGIQRRHQHGRHVHPRGRGPARHPPSVPHGLTSSRVASRRVCPRRTCAPSTRRASAGRWWQRCARPDDARGRSFCQSELRSPLRAARSAGRGRHGIASPGTGPPRGPASTANSVAHSLMVQSVPVACGAAAVMSSHEPELDDEDTGPLHLDSVREHPVGARDRRFDVPLSVNPLPVQQDCRHVVLTGRGGRPQWSASA